jgi:hypothetical protein
LIASSKSGALNFVDDGAIKTANEPARIGPCRIQDGLVVEGDIGPALFAHLPDERGLAGTARPDDQHHRGVDKSLFGKRSLNHILF